MGRRRHRYSGEFTFRPKRFKLNRSKIAKSIFNWLLLILGAAVLGYALIAFCFQTVTVFGPSMNDTLSDGQVVIVNKLSYKFGDVERYDVIAYSKDDEYYDIKRVVGLPGERIIIKEGCVYVNDVILDQQYFNEKILNSGVASKEIILGDNEYFVLGDNVNNSDDSRYVNVGNIHKTEILGKVTRIYSPKQDKGKIK